MAPLTCAIQGPGSISRCHLGDRAVGHAEQDEVGLVGLGRLLAAGDAHAAATLLQASGEGAADAAGADDSDGVDLRLQFQWIPGT